MKLHGSKLGRTLLALALSAATALAHGSEIPPPPPEPPPPPPIPIKKIPNAAPPDGRKPSDDEPPPPPPPPPPRPIGPLDRPDPKPEPLPDPAPDPKRPTTPENPRPDGGGRDGKRKGPVSGRRTTAVSHARSWRIWWAHNRVSLAGLRGLLRQTGPITGAAAERAADPLAASRPLVREALRRVALRAEDRTLRAGAILALGRCGEELDAVLFLRLLNRANQPSDVHEAAALALGLLPPIRDPGIRASVDAYLEHSLKYRRHLKYRARAFAIFSAGLRAREDESVMMALLARATRPMRNTDEAAHIAMAAGLARNRMLVPELLRAAERGTLGGQRLDDVARSHAVTALAWTGDPAAMHSLMKILRARSTGIETRRSAALGLGFLLRGTGGDSAAPAKRVTETLLREMGKSSDAVLRGYCAVALGSAGQGVAEMKNLVDHGGAGAVKPYAALGLGLAATRVNKAEARSIRVFLRDEWGKTHDPELSSAAALALGLARAVDATPDLLARAKDRRRTASERAAAAQALGLLGKSSPQVDRALFELLDAGDPEVIEGAALALGLLGRRSAAPVLLKKLERTNSNRIRASIILALGHLGSPATVEPMIEILKSEKQKPIVREYAALALGLIAGHTDPDPLFDIDAGFNHFATTTATHELVRLY